MVRTCEEDVHGVTSEEVESLALADFRRDKGRAKSMGEVIRQNIVHLQHTKDIVLDRKV